MIRRAPADTITEYFAAIRALDRDAWVACFAPQATTNDPVGAPPTVGHAGLRAFFDGFLAQVRTLSIVEDAVHVNGTRAAVRWIGRGVGKASGRSFVFTGIDVFEFDADGRIVRMDGYWDPAALMTQLAP